MKIPTREGDSVALEDLGPGRIFLRDGSMKKACTVREIHELYIIYVKNEVLHDQMIDKILRIELTEGKSTALIFDEKNRPRIVGWPEEDGE